MGSRTAIGGNCWRGSRFRSLALATFFCPSLFAQDFVSLDLQPTIVHRTHHFYGVDRLKRLQEEQNNVPIYQDIGTFTEVDGTKVLLCVKVIKVCEKNPPCTPLIWRENEGQVVQYELHNCKCDRAEIIARAREKQKERYAAFIRKGQEKKRLIERENERFGVYKRARLRKNNLKNRIEKINYRHRMSIWRHGRCRNSCCRNYRYRYGGGP